jgi:hypothetical protein
MMKDFFSHRASEDYDVESEHLSYRKHVFTHLSSLEGMILEYYGADSASHEFNIEGITFKVLADPDDGYRSHLGVVEYGDQSSAIFFRKPIAKVRIETYEGRSQDYVKADQGYKLVDVEDNHTWLEFGTDNTDDYYPYFVFRHLPKRRKVENESR